MLRQISVNVDTVVNSYLQMGFNQILETTQTRSISTDVTTQLSSQTIQFFNAGDVFSLRLSGGSTVDETEVDVADNVNSLISISKIVGS